MVPSTSTQRLADLQPERLHALIFATDHALTQAERARPPAMYVVVGVGLSVMAAGAAAHGALVQAGVTVVGALGFLAPWLYARARQQAVARLHDGALNDVDARRLLEATRIARARVGDGRPTSTRATALIADIERQLR